MPDRSPFVAPAWGNLLLAVIAVVLVASHTPVGAALSMDSLYYLSTASNLLDGNGIVHSTHALGGPVLQSTTLWPPLYPVLVAAIKWVANLTGTSDVFAISVFNVMALIVSLYLVARIASMVASVPAGIVVAIAIAISPTMQIVFAYAWSEVLFIPLCLAAYLSLQRYLTGDEGVSKRWLYAMIVLLGLATYTRYVGLAFFSSAALAMLLYGRGALLQRLRTVTLVTLAYLVFLVPMLLRNLVQAGSFSGGDRGSPDTNLLSDLATLTWYLYLEFLNLPVMIGVVTILVALVSAIWLLTRHAVTSERGGLSTGLPNIIVPFLFAACYMVFLLISRGRQTIDLDSRMLSVVIPFLLVGLLGIYQQLSLRAGNRLAVLPFVLPLTAFAIGAYHTHTNILTGWRELGEPGPILGKTYYSMTGRQMDTLRGIGEHFKPGNGDLVLTDITRPFIVEYLFPDTDVRQMPTVPNDWNTLEVESALQREGIAIIGGSVWSQALFKSLEGRARFNHIADQTGRTKYVVITLPVDAK